MNLRVSWSVPTQEHSAIWLYRSDANTSVGLTLEGLEPIAKLPMGTSEYLDTGLPSNTSFYYNAVVVDTEGNLTPSTWYNLGTFLTTGVGNVHTPTIGDFNLGFFEDLELNDFVPTPQELTTILGFTVTSARFPTKWCKVAVNNKIYILAKNNPAVLNATLSGSSALDVVKSQSFAVGDFTYKLVDLLLNQLPPASGTFEPESFTLKLLNGLTNPNTNQVSLDRTIGGNDEQRFILNVTTDYNGLNAITLTDPTNVAVNISTNTNGGSAGGYAMRSTIVGTVRSVLHIYELQL